MRSANNFLILTANSNRVKSFFNHIWGFIDVNYWCLIFRLTMVPNSLCHHIWTQPLLLLISLPLTCGCHHRYCPNATLRAIWFIVLSCNSRLYFSVHDTSVWGFIPGILCSWRCLWASWSFYGKTKPVASFQNSIV